MSDAPQNPTPANDGLSDSAASGLAYITIIPAIIFLVVAPYNQKPVIKFHAWQCLGLAAAEIALVILGIFFAFIPVIRSIWWIVADLGYLAIVILWILCVINAFQGKIFRIPVIGDFAAKQAGL
jgi:uncharacterized membrane protein